MTRRLLLALSLSVGVAALGLALSAHAVSTRTFVIEDLAQFSAGELERTTALSDGTLRVGAELRRIAMPDIPVAYSLARAADGTAFIGTGPDGKVFRLRGEQLDLLAETHQLAVTSLALGEGGVLYAGTLPEGRIYAIDAGGALRELARPASAEHVWALAWDARRRTLFAGTGPEGKVFGIAPQGQADVFFDAEASHVMSLALDTDGTLYAGTSDQALVVKLTGPGRAEVVHDFPGNEITALAARDGALAIAANEFGDPPAPPSGGVGAVRPTATRPRPGKGRLFRRLVDGRVEQVLQNDEGHFTSVQLAPDGTLYAGVAKDGRIVRVAPDRTTATWIDVDERQVMALDVLGAAPLFVTSDAAAIYRIVDARPASAQWTSKVLDAQFPARFGRIAWRGEGTLEVQTRSGNVERPDTTWSEWSAPVREAARPGEPASGTIRSPGARFLQLRVRFAADPQAVLRSITAWYLPQNQRAHVRDVSVARGGTKNADTTTDDVPAPAPQLKITWKIDNPDNDRIRYRLRFRADSNDVLRDLSRELETVTRTEYTWETGTVPDGWYRVRVEASDELVNAEPYVLRAFAESAPVLVDNHAPRIDALQVTGRRVTGRAVDPIGPIARLELSVDGGELRPILPTDDLLDSAEESFAVDLPADVLGGSRIVAVRATDAAGNAVTSEIVAQVAAPAAAPAAAAPAPARRRP